MRRYLLLTFILLGAASQASSQVLVDTTIPTHAKVADVASTVGVIGDLGMATYQAWRSPNRGRALLCEGLRLGASIGAVNLAKTFIHEERPDGSDNQSFYSEHTTIAAAAPNFGISLMFSLGVGVGRVVADKHHWWDVAIGAGAGEATRFIPGCR